MAKILTDTGESYKGLPVVRLGDSRVDAARARREAALHAIMRAETRGEPVTRAMRDEAVHAKADLFAALNSVRMKG